MRPLPPPRGRTPSGHDIPIPETVFTALLDVSKGIADLTAEVRAGKADTDSKIAEVKELAQKASAQSVERWTNLAKALVPLAVAIVGGTYGVQRLAAPSAPAPTAVHESALSAELRVCQQKPEAEQRYCVANAYETDRIRRRGRP